MMAPAGSAASAPTKTPDDHKDEYEEQATQDASQTAPAQDALVGAIHHISHRATPETLFPRTLEISLPSGLTA